MMESMLGAFVMAQRLYAFDWTAIPAFDRRGDSPGADSAYLSNGLVGIRPGRIPLLPAPTCVAGFVFVEPDQRVESLSPAPYPLTTDLRLNGVSLLDSPERCILKTQHLDMSNGELTTAFTFDLGESSSAAIVVRQAALRTEPSLLFQRVDIQVTSTAHLEFSPQITTAGIPGQIVREGVPSGGKADLALLFRSLGDLAQLGIAVMVKPAKGFTLQQGSATYNGELQQGNKYTFDTLASLVSSFYHQEPDIEAIRLVNWGSQTGVETLIDSNRKAWSELWKSRVIVAGSPDDQRVLDSAFFYLHSSNHPANLNGMAPYGLSQSRYYLGHSFWDTETWSFLPLLLSSPEAAKSLLVFRRRGLEAAKQIAGLFGYRGAQFPWEAAPLNGQDVTPVFAATGWAEQHIVPDVALAFWQYQLATGDKDFLEGATWPVLRAVAEWIESRGVTTQRGFEIRNIMGPDESRNGLDNSAYVNIACRMVMKASIRCAQMMGRTVPAQWHRIATTMYLPINGDGVLTIGDGSSKDALGDISCLFPFDVDLDQTVFQRTWRAFYDKKVSAGAIGFVMAATSAAAAAMGDRKAAADLFRLSWQPFWLEPFGMIREISSQTYGCFLTDYGSILQTAMLGFTGIRIGESDWAKYDAVLPENWNSIEIERIYVRGEGKHVIAKHGSRARIVDA